MLTINNEKAIKKEEDVLLKERFNVLLNALLMEECSSSQKEDSLRSIFGKKSFFSQMIDVLKDGHTDLPVTKTVDGVQLRDYMFLLGDALRNLTIARTCQRPDPDGTMRYKIVFESTSGRNYFVIFSISKEPLAMGVSEDLRKDVELRWMTQTGHFKK